MNMLLNVHQNNLLNLKDTSYIFHNLSALHTLILFVNNISNFDNALGYLPSLHKLDLSHQNLSSISNKMFPEISAIKYLNISNNQINQIYPNTFVNMQNLEHLDLSHNQIKNMHIASLHGLLVLQSLNLSYNHYTVDKYLIFNTPKLSFLDISYNNLSDIDETLFKGSHLSSINIDGMPLSCIRLVEIVKYFKTLNINCVAGKEKNRLHLFGMHCNHSDVIESTTMQNVIESTNIPNSDIQLSNNKILAEMLNVLNRNNDINLNANLTQGVNIQLSNNNNILSEVLNVLKHINDKNVNANPTQEVNIQLFNISNILSKMLDSTQVHDMQEKSDITTHILLILLIMCLIFMFIFYIWRTYFVNSNQYVPTENLITDFELSNR
ncbi:protein artichoke-like [Atheta coriaria]|uniref:protein artichoke-like n=1 Tax=Dalotia coriaria TaxID=877792 RepID=UPI0031F3E218